MSTSRRFFEGWYFKVSLPEEKQSFAWMYSVEDPGAANGSFSGLGDFFEGAKFPGVGAQIMGADDKYLYQFDESVKSFWGSKFLHFHRLFIHPFSCAGFLGKKSLFLSRILHCISRQTYKTKLRPWPNRVILLLNMTFGRELVVLHTKSVILGKFSMHAWK
jgi:hypothetical protein